MRVEIVGYWDLPPGTKVSHNGVGAEEANYLRIQFPDETEVIYSDAMEPEDARFTRDLSWIKEALIQAYEMGRKE